MLRFEKTMKSRDRVSLMEAISFQRIDIHMAVLEIS